MFITTLPILILTQGSKMEENYDIIDTIILTAIVKSKNYLPVRLPEGTMDVKLFSSKHYNVFELECSGYKRTAVVNSDSQIERTTIEHEKAIEEMWFMIHKEYDKRMDDIKEMLPQMLKDDMTRLEAKNMRLCTYNSHLSEENKRLKNELRAYGIYNKII